MADFAALPDATLTHIFGHLDATSLLRMTEVDTRCRTLACHDVLWRDVMAYEKPSPMVHCGPAPEAPSWAVHAPVPRGEVPQTSWRQAYRLSAMWERGRPDIAWPFPELARIDAPVAASWPTHRRPALPRPALFKLFDTRHGPLSLNQFAGALDHLHGSRFQLEVVPGYTALRSSRGEVTIFSGQREQFGAAALKLSAKGRLARRLFLVNDRASDGLASAAARDPSASGQPLCITVSGRCIEAWHPGDGHAVWRRNINPESTKSPPAPLRTKLLGGQHRQFLAAFGPGHKLTTLDLNTGDVLFETDKSADVFGVSLLTPQAGPLVAWTSSRRLHCFPIVDFARMGLLHRPCLFRHWPVLMYGTPDVESMWRLIYDIRADAQTPGRLIVSVAALNTQRTGHTTLRIDGWGTSRHPDDYAAEGMVLRS